MTAPAVPRTWLCRRGAHRWRRIHTLTRPGGLASITSKCTRPGCPALRHDQHVPAPTPETP